MSKAAIRQHFIDRHVARKKLLQAELIEEVEDAIENTVIQFRMPIDTALAFLRAGGERHDAHFKH